MKIRVAPATRAGVYVVEPAGEESTFAGIPVEMYRLADPAPREQIEELCEKAGSRRATLTITEILSSPRVMEYVAVNGKRYRFIWLPGAAAAVVDNGFRVGKPRNAVIVPVVGVPLPEPGERVEACWVAMKAGRGDFHTSGTSHQLNIYVYY